MTPVAQTWTVRVVACITMAGAAVFWQDDFRASDAVLLIGGIGFFGGPVVLGATGGFKSLAIVAVAAFLFVSAISMVNGIDEIGLHLPECNGPMQGFSPDPCGHSMAARALAGTYPAVIIMAFGSIPAGIRLLWRKRAAR